MAQELTEVTITVDRALKTGVVSGDSLQIRDTSVELTLVNVDQADIDAGLVFSIFKGNTIFAVCSSWTANGNGDAVGTLNTNTEEFDTIFADASAKSRKNFFFRIYCTNLQVPICTDVIQVENFIGDVVGTPTSIASPAEVLAQMQSAIDAAEASVEELDSAVQALSTQISDALSGIGTQISNAITAHDEDITAHLPLRNRIYAMELKLDLSAITNINVTTGTLKQTKEVLYALIEQLKV